MDSQLSRLAPTVGGGLSGLPRRKDGRKVETKTVDTIFLSGGFISQESVYDYYGLVVDQEKKLIFTIASSTTNYLVAYSYDKDGVMVEQGVMAIPSGTISGPDRLARSKKLDMIYISSDSSDKVIAVDTSDLDGMSIEAVFYDTNWVEYPTSLAVDEENDVLYISSEAANRAVAMDISVKSALTIINSVTNLTDCYRVELDEENQVLYVVRGTSTQASAYLYAFDVSNIRSTGITQLGSYIGVPEAKSCRGSFIQGDFLYLSGLENTISIVNISDPSDMSLDVEITGLKFSNFYWLAASSEVIVIGSRVFALSTTAEGLAEASLDTYEMTGLYTDSSRFLADSSLNGLDYDDEYKLIFLGGDRRIAAFKYQMEVLA